VWSELDGSHIVIFTLLRLPGVTESKFSDDAKWVEKDLVTLKALLEPH
jgi:hypothetical protein